MSESEAMLIEDQYLAPLYQKFPITLVKGKGALVWDSEGKEYIDCVGGYGVAIVGHCNPRVVEAVKAQVEKLITCHGSFYNDARSRFLEKLFSITPRRLDRAYLCNSGAEANEFALKLARKYTKRTEIIAMTGSFHGKTMGALSATWNPRYREPFMPLVPDFRFAPFGNVDKVRELASEKTAAIIVEPVQGESGIHVPPDGFHQSIRKICDEVGALLIHDEVQSGLGRTGRMWASEHWEVEPDIMCIAKGLAGGIPLGAALVRGDIASCLRAGDHTSTFGGNAVSSAAGAATIEAILEGSLVQRAESLGGTFREGLKKLMDEHNSVREVRGLGLMIGVELRFDVKDILFEALGRGVLLLYSGRNILRLLPPLVIDEGKIAKVLEVLDDLLERTEKARLQARPS